MTYLKHMLWSISTLLLFAVMTHAQSIDANTTKSKQLAVFYTIQGDIENKYNDLVENKLKPIHFHLTDPHKRVNDRYKTKWGSSVLDLLSFMPVVNDHVLLPLLNIDPRIAGFAPFNMLIYKKHDENVTYIGHLMPKVMLDILGIKNKEVREKFTATFPSLNKLIEKEIGGEKHYISYNKLPKQTMLNYEYHFKTPKNMEDFIDDFQENFEQAFIDKGYLLAGYHNFMDATDDAGSILNHYDAFWTYSLCHLGFSYSMFDNEGATPEAGLFAPCTIYMYIKKGTNTVVMGMYRLHNWSDTLHITDKKRLALIDKLDSEIPQILTNFGMKATENVNPLTHIVTQTTTPAKIEIPTPTHTNKQDIKQKQKTSNTKAVKHIQVIKIGNHEINITLPAVPTPVQAIHFDDTLTNRAIKFSKRVPPNYIPHRFDHIKKIKVSTNTRIGETNKGRISAYLRGAYMEVSEVEKRLKKAGFTILTAAPVNKKKTLISVVFTNPDIIHMASKPNRGFIATLRVLVDTKEKRISITNPLYLCKGFLQSDFDEKAANKILVNIIQNFPSLKNSKDVLKFQLLPSYQFMNGMPHYEDMLEVASGDDLLERIKNNKKIVFTQTLENGSVLVGIKLGKRTRKFTKRIGRNNAAMLPYPVLIENDKAKILDPKYYIAFMYPLLQMSEFMTIATIPDAIYKDAQRVFRKKKKK